MEKPAPDVMTRRPRPPNGVVLYPRTRHTNPRARFHHGDRHDRRIRLRLRERRCSLCAARAFYITIFAQLFFSFACRSQRFTLPQLGVFTNPYLFAAILVSGTLQLLLLWFPLTRAIFFKTTPHFGFDWLVIFFLALTPVSMVEIDQDHPPIRMMKASNVRVKTSAETVVSQRRPIINAMFAPKSVALIGASEKPGSVGRALLENLQSFTWTASFQ